MSEIVPNRHDREQKPKPLTDKCDNCKQTYAINEHTGRLYEFYQQPECNYVMCQCPNCHFRTQIFLGEQQFTYAIQSGVPLRKVDEENPPQRYADEQTYNSWLEVKGIELPATHELTQRHEKTVREFGQAILNIPDELFWDGMESEHGTPYPLRWI